MWLPLFSTTFPHQYWRVWGSMTKDEDSRTETNFAQGEGRMARETYLLSLSGCWNGTRVIISPPLLHSFLLVSYACNLGNVAALFTYWLKDTVTASHLTSTLTSLSWSSLALFLEESVRSGPRVIYFSASVVSGPLDRIWLTGILLTGCSYSLSVIEAPFKVKRRVTG